MMRFIGWAFVLCLGLGALNIIDFKVCIAGAKECQCQKDQI